MEVVVIGNGVAGEAACAAIRSSSGETNITLISEDRHPFYSPCILNQYISQEVKRSRLFLKRLGDYKREAVNLFLGQRVERVDPSRKSIFTSDREIIYDKLIMATGSRPIVPPIEGVQKRGVKVFKSLTDADSIVRSKGSKAIVIGSGPIGVEIAVALRKRNWHVCLIEALDWILPNLFDEEGASLIRNILEKNGVEVLTGERVVSIEGKGHVRGVVTSGAGGYEADMVVLSVGMRPSVELARQAGCEIGELGGILTDEEMQTHVNDIYACGDCVQGKDPCTGKQKLSLLWPQAERQGTAAGYNCLGGHRSVHRTPDVVNLHVFGTFVGAMGQPARMLDNGRTEVVKVSRMGKYHCFVISEGKWAGAQFIGDHDGMGILLPFMGRGYEESCRKIMDEAETARFPWYHPARTFFSVRSPSSSR